MVAKLALEVVQWLRAFMRVLEHALRRLERGELVLKFLFTLVAEEFVEFAVALVIHFLGDRQRDGLAFQ